MKYIKLTHANSEHKNWFVVNWCLGNTCNFNCSYCPSGLHDGSKRWPDAEDIKQFISTVRNQLPNKNLYFEFTGGEVTLYKNFTEICQFCTDNSVKVGLISNGSRTLRYWEEHKQYFDHVCLSYHPEYANQQHFFDVVQLLKDDLRVHVNIMMSPTKFDECYQFAKRVAQLGNISMALQPLIHDFGDRLYNYSLEQKDLLDSQHEQIVKTIQVTKRFPYYRGAMAMVDAGGNWVTSSPHRFIADGTNNWNNWNCYAGVEQIIVDMDGSIYRGWCKVGETIGSIFDKSLVLPTTPVVCNKQMCHCNFDVMSTKEQQ